jgi:HSP20 family protein
MLLVRNSNQTPSLFDRFFDGEMFDWNNLNFSNTNTTLTSVNIKDTADGDKIEAAYEKGILSVSIPKA